MQSNLNRVIGAIKHLNNVYGRGDISNVRMFASGLITFDQTPYGCKPAIRLGRIKGDTVMALGHQRTIKAVR
jgi:hypothetical protein